MISIFKKEQLEKLNNYYVEVIKSISEIIEILNENYGENRDVDKDLGGYVLIVESIEDVEELKNGMLKDILPEYTDEVNEKVSYKLVKEILQNFSKVLSNCKTREKQKMLLHMIISEITIGKDREIESINLNINDKLIEYLSNEEGESKKAAPSSFLLRNVNISMLNLDIAI